MKKPYLFCLVGLLLAAMTVEASAQSNTIVRFRISYGARVLGNIDVELFDQDKPVTVSNFLAYVDSGRYKRTLLHRLLPGFVIQGGAGEIVNPYSQALFQVVNRTVMDPPITNEFNVGTVRSNLFGTLAMAKQTNDANTATSSWFFNLADNSANRTNDLNLDQQNGGFTVFGHVIAGTNLFTTFNRLTLGDGIMNVADKIFYPFACGAFTYIYEDGGYSFFDEGTDLPVSFRGAYCVRYSDLLVVDVFRLDGPTDTVSPTVALAAPALNTTITNDFINVSGTASDNVGVDSVDVILNHERLYTFEGAANWSGTVTNIQPGTNTLTVVSLDAKANESKPVFRNFFYRVQKSVTLDKVGLGTVTGVTNGQLIDLARIYRLVATPALGYIFTGWEGTNFVIASPSGDPSETTLLFFARTNPTIRAVFIPNPFIPTKGTYNGLLSEVGTVHGDRAGYITATVTDRGTFSGRLTIGGRPLPFKGLLQPDGSSSLRLVRNVTNDLFLRLNLDVTNGTCQVTGTVSILSGAWEVPLVADRVFYNIKTNPAPQAGAYTMVIPGRPGSNTEPQGDGYTTIKVDGNGRVTVAGALADGTKLVQKTTISKNGAIPLFGNLYIGKGMAIGWLDIVTNNASTDIVGDVGWVKPAVTLGKYYPAGFVVLADDVFGSKFVRPATATNRVVNISTGTVTFTGGNLPSNFANDITIAENSLVKTTDPNKLVLVFNKVTGLMTGVAVHPDGVLVVPIIKFSGVVLQKQESASGFFLGTSKILGVPSESGRVVVAGP